MSNVLEFFRQQEPRFKDVPDGELTDFIRTQYPEFEQDADFAKTIQARAAIVSGNFLGNSQALWEGLPAVEIQKPQPSWIKQTLPIPAFAPETPEDVLRAQAIQRAQGNWSPAAYPDLDPLAPAAKLAKFGASEQPVTTVERWAVEKVPVFKPLRDWIGTEGTTQFMRNMADAPAGALEFFTSPLGVAAGIAGAAPPTRLLTSAAFLGDLSYNLKQQVASSIKDWDQMSDADKGRALAGMVTTGAFAALIGAHVGKQGVGLARRGVEALKPEIGGQTKPATPYERGQPPPGYQPVRSATEGPILPPGALPPPPPPPSAPPVAPVAPLPPALPSPSAPIGDARRLQLMEDLSQGRPIPAGNVAPGEEALIEPAGYVREGEVWVNRSVLQGPALPKLLGGGGEPHGQKVQETREVTGETGLTPPATMAPSRGTEPGAPGAVRPAEAGNLGYATGETGLTGGTGLNPENPVNPVPTISPGQGGGPTTLKPGQPETGTTAPQPAPVRPSAPDRKALSPSKGQTVFYNGEQPGTVIRKQGPKAVLVSTTRTKTSQDFISGKVTTETVRVQETWPISKIAERRGTQIEQEGTEGTEQAGEKQPPPAVEVERRPGFERGQTVYVRLRADLNKLHKARVQQVQPDGDVTVRFVSGPHKDKYQTLAGNLVQEPKSKTTRRLNEAEFEAFPPAERKQAKADARAFKDLVRNEGPRFGWYDPAVEGVETREGQMAQNKAMATGIARAFKEAKLQGNPESPADRARNFGKLKDWIESKRTPEERQNAAWDQATKEGDQRIEPSDLKVGDVLVIEGENCEVVGVDPDTGAVTLKDGRKFGRQTLEEGDAIYVEDFKGIEEGPDWVEPEEVAPGVPKLSPEEMARVEREAKEAEARIAKMFGGKPKVEQEKTEGTEKPKPTPPPKPAVEPRALTKKEQAEFEELTLKARAWREKGGEPLTSEETQRYDLLNALAGQQDLLGGQFAGANTSRIAVLEEKLAQLDKLRVATQNRAWDSKHRREELFAEAKAYQAEADRVRAQIRELKAADAREAAGGGGGTDLFASPPALGPGGALGDTPPTRPEMDARHSVFDAVPMEMPEAVQVVKALTGDYPKIREHLRALGGEAAGVFQFTQGETGKGRVALKAGIFDLLTQEEKARIREEAAAYAQANKLNPREAREYLQTKFEEAYEEAKTKNPVQAMKVIWHEIGHVVDWLPEKIIRGRGNLFGRLASLKNYLKGTLPIDPTRPASGRMSPGELNKLRKVAAHAAQAEIGPMREIIETILVEEPIYREAGITPEMVKRLFGMDARETMPELYKWFAEQPADVKKEIVKAAMKGLVDERLKSAPVAGSEQVGTRQVKKEIRRREGRPPTPDEIERKFRELLRAEILKRNLAELKLIKEELAPVIAWWRGTEKMPDYFKTSPEMYAEAFSVFANNPAALAARAPIYSRMLWNYLERKPEVRALYDEIQADIKAGRVMGNRVRNLREMFERDARTSLDLEHSRNKITGRDFLDNVRYHMDRRFGPVYRLTRGYAKEGAVREAIGSFLYRATEHERFLGNLNDSVGKPLVRHNLDWADLGEYLFHKRIIEERYNLANPLGWTSKNSLERLSEMQRTLGPERWAALEDAGRQFRAQYEDAVTGPIRSSRMFTPELQQILDTRAHYATFSALKGVPDNGIENILATQYGASVTPQIYRQIGMAGEIKNPATATVLKGLSLISANLRNTAKREIAALLRAKDPESIAPAKMRWNGKTREPVMVETPKVGTLVWLDEGKVQAAYVRRHVADAINAGNAAENLLLAGMRNVSGWLKGLFTQLNYAFWPVNFVRDTMGWQMQLPGGGPVAYARVLPRALAAARASVTRSKPNRYAEQALRRRMVISQADPRGVWAAADNEFDLQVARMGMDPAAWSKHADKVHVLAKAWNHYRELGQTVERVNKIAGMIHLDERYPNMPEWKKREIVRERAGSPNFLERGASNPYVDMFMLFYNPWKEGIRSLGKSAYENPWSFGGKAAVAMIAPTVLQAAAVNGWLGDDMRERYAGASDYDLTNYLIPPPKWVNASQGKVAYLRLPLWEPARLAHGILFQLLTERGQGVTSFAGGQLPGLNPILSTALAWVQYAMGQNPQDRHRGVGVLTDQQQAARAKSWADEQAMLKWTWNNMGGSILFRFQNPNLESPPDSTAERILRWPGINNFLGRWIKVSNRGLFDEQRASLGDVRADRAALQLAVLPIVDKVLDGTALTPAEIMVLREPYALKYFMQKHAELLPGRKHVLFQLLNDAQTSQEKLLILGREAERLRR